MIDPVEALMKTSTILPTIPSTKITATASATAFPTVIPDPPVYEKATAAGFRTLWVVFVVMVLSSVAFAAMAWTIPLSRRLFHTITTLITVIAAISYFGMATGHGVNYQHIHHVEHHKHVPNTHKEIFRQVFWARYVDWCLTTPLLLLDLFFLAGASGGHIIMAIAADIIMVLTGLFAAYGSTHNAQRWGWYAIACIAFLVVIWHLVVNGGANARARSANLGKFYGAISAYTILIWVVYPIIWGVADGARLLSVNQEIIAYAVLDILAKPVFGAWLLLTHSRMADAGFELGGFWTFGLHSEGRLRLEEDEGA
ncbi:uncharacterized protein PV09_02004 [Verruconis gallopava]|uniref:Family A G protein-coupled receptor-like protein n=1 Tax=Verruconis gallopava TaxID=253628 RepID=A0A0D1Z2G5_9PEZI|nr:uncharacterized protein PV09_02004 [Verruconis gallopava]KIW07132.1 hypothetical protein PV09_02004 [Verruconis gallopava]